jgi:DNA-binding FadR family transcriptional regulator
MVALALSSNNTTVMDVFWAQQHIESVCVVLCAERPDRATAVVPLLRERNETASSMIDADLAEFIPTMKAFHQVLAEKCGNDTLALFAGVVESICFSKYLEKSPRKDSWRTRQAKMEAIKIHVDISDLIEAGDGVGAASLVREHHVSISKADLSPFSENVDASAIRPSGITLADLSG